jgi:hypothetical protein
VVATATDERVRWRACMAKVAREARESMRTVIVAGQNG